MMSGEEISQYVVKNAETEEPFQWKPESSAPEASDTVLYRMVHASVNFSGNLSTAEVNI